MRTVEIDIQGVSPLSWSRYLLTQKAEGEDDTDMEKRVWRDKFWSDTHGLFVPAMAIKNSLVDAAAYRGEARGLLTTARKNVERDHNLLIETVSKEGIKKSGAVAGVLERTVTHIGRVSRRASSRVVNACVNRELSNDERTSVGVQLSLLGAIQQFAKPKAARQLENKVRENEMKELPSAQTIRLFVS